MDKKLLDIICCPVTYLPLEPLDAGRLARLNAAIARGGVQTRGEEPVQAPLDEALVTRDGRLAYPVRDGIPLLLEAEGLDLAQLTDDACA